MKKKDKKNELNYRLIILILLAVVAFVAMIIIFIKRGTFGLDASGTVTIECPNTITDTSSVECDIKLSYTKTDDYKILSVNARYNFDNNVQYVSFTSNCTDCEVNEATENGFAIGKLDGFDSDYLIGKVKVSLPNDIDDETTFQIGLTEIELSDNNYEMHELSDVSDSITIKPTESSSNLTFDESLNVDESEHIIYNLPINTKYIYLIDKITTSGTITILDKSNNQITTDSFMGTNGTLNIKIGDDVVSYKISVLKDLNGDGQIGTGDVKALYEIYKKDTDSISQLEIYNGDLNGDGRLGTGDVKALYEAYKNSSSVG